jgi:hypothetical protein
VEVATLACVTGSNLVHPKPVGEQVQIVLKRFSVDRVEVGERFIYQRMHTKTISLQFIDVGAHIPEMVKITVLEDEQAKYFQQVERLRYETVPIV